ncbi:ABC transporter permease [Rhodoluna sp.]|uniref:ABC transporter permease n=1 Tax=Rhodoluna sp. TaxID=1969481 RepID=UPI0025DE26E7|nr:ABC transporter permease [Rhodoluna sp.]
MKAFDFKKLILPFYAVIAFVFLLLPIAYTVAFSFNDSTKSNAQWQGFTLNNWLQVCVRQGVCEAVGSSILIGVISTLIATVLGTMIAIALVRYKFKAREAVSLGLFLPMATPEVVMGSGLAAEFFNLGIGQGYLTIIIAHVMFCLSFVVVTVKARVQTLDPALEEAGRDLYANPRRVFMKITLPLLMPGIAAAALLSFALSFDDFIITYFNGGQTVTTFPIFIYAAATRGVPAEANVIGSAVFFLAIAIVLFVQIRSSLRNTRLAKLK